ncbi:hypothetical protein Tco_1291533 [Tanacetum coccineum]
MPSFLPHEPTVSCFNDLDFFKDFENEFPTIVYNDAPTSKSDLLTEPILSPQHLDEFNLNDETSLSEYDEEEHLYFNDLFPFNIIHPNDLKSEKDNDDNEIDIIQSSGVLGMVTYLVANLTLDTQLPVMLLVGAYEFHQDPRLSSVFKVPFPLFATGISLGPVFLLGLSVFAMAAVCASMAAVKSSISCRIASKVMAGV